MEKDLYTMMHPNCVAIVGASAKAGSVGNELLSRAKDAQFKGKLIAINPKYKEINGVPCFASLLEAKQKIDLAVIAVPAMAVLDTLKQCAKIDTRCAVIISNGFKEAGEQGKAMEQEIADFATKNKMTIVGPNCLGVINTADDISLNACFAPLQAKKGTIGFATQSGALASGIINILPNLKIGIAQMISLGNQCSINSLDVLKYWENDDNIKQILLYLEALPDSQEFRETATRISKKKPIIVLKSGRSERGAKASMSHTGSLAGDDATAQGIFMSAGVIREFYLRDLFNTAQLISKSTLPKQDNLAILTNAGGPGIIATDTASDLNIPIAMLSDRTKQKLRSILSDAASVNNPVDIIADATAETYHNSAKILLEAPEVGALLAIYLYITGKNDIKIMQSLTQLKKQYPNKPIMAVLMTTPDFPDELQQTLPDCDVPMYDFIVDALHSYAQLIKYRDFIQNADLSVPKIKVNKTAVQKILKEASTNPTKQLTTWQSLQVFANYGLPTPLSGNATNLHDAIKIANKIG